jgi:uncharacterized protein YjbI with pentapeptide repeats
MKLTESTLRKIVRRLVSEAVFDASYDASPEYYRGDSLNSSINFSGRRPSAEEIEEAVKLHEAWLRGSVDGRQADFSGSILEYGDFISAKLDKAIFKGANLKEALFGFASLVGADFSDTDLSTTDFTGAKLDNCDLRGAKIGYKVYRAGSLANIKCDDEVAKKLESESKHNILSAKNFSRAQ